MNSRKYFIFIRSKRAFEAAKKILNWAYAWDDLRGAGWATTVELNRKQLSNLKVKLWNCKYQLLRVR